MEKISISTNVPLVLPHVSTIEPVKQTQNVDPEPKKQISYADIAEKANRVIIHQNPVSAMYHFSASNVGQFINETA